MCILTGYTSAEGCIEDFENTSDFSRNFQAQQKCICDTEHMFNCPASGSPGNDQATPMQNKAGDAVSRSIAHLVFTFALDIIKFGSAVRVSEEFIDYQDV